MDLTIGEHVNQMRQIEKRTFGRHMDFVVAWPHDAGPRDKRSGLYLRDQYKEFGLRVMHEHAPMFMKDGSKSNSLEGSIQAADTWHETLEAAKSQASSEYGIEESDWKEV